MAVWWLSPSPAFEPGVRLRTVADQLGPNKTQGRQCQKHETDQRERKPVAQEHCMPETGGLGVL